MSSAAPDGGATVDAEAGAAEPPPALSCFVEFARFRGDSEALRCFEEASARVGEAVPRGFDRGGEAVPRGGVLDRRGFDPLEASPLEFWLLDSAVAFVGLVEHLWKRGTDESCVGFVEHLWKRGTSGSSKPFGPARPSFLEGRPAARGPADASTGPFSDDDVRLVARVDSDASCFWAPNAGKSSEAAGA